MPSRLAAPVLTVDAAKMHKVDPRNVESLFGMWMVFSKCAESIEEGKRLENLSWRLWNRETFCCEPQPHLATTPAIDVQLPRPSSKEVPELSSSVDSVASDGPARTQTDRPASRRRPRTQDSEDSALSRSRGKEKHITSLGLKKMVLSIKEKTDIEPLSPTIQASLPAMSDITPRPLSPFPQVDTTLSTSEQRLTNSSESCDSMGTTQTDSTDRNSEHRGSDTSVSSGGLIKSGSIVHGFSPSQMSSSLRSKTMLTPEVTIPIRVALANKVEVPKRGGMFTLGGSSGEEESSFEDRMSVPAKKSSLSEGLTTKAAERTRAPSLKELVQSRRIDEGETEDEDAIESDEASESAIEEDDGDWEDSNSDSGKSSVEDRTLFQRVESQANLVSRRSMLTMQLHEPQRASNLAKIASRSSPALRRSRTSSPHGPSVAASPDDADSGLTMRGPQASRPMPIICTTTNTHPPPHSPRTTRRNMLATELGESLRKHLLWERKQKSTTANAFLSRRHTAQNMAHLQQYPGPSTDASRSNNSWNHYYDAPSEYHTRGW